MTESPLVSVIVPTYNRAKTLPETLDSILNQTYNAIEIIVVDDGSTDETKDVMEKYKNVIYIYQENKGQASARNTGLKRASGEIISSLDSDDIWYPDFLSRCVAKLKEDHLDFVFANWDQEESDGVVRDFLITDVFIAPYFPRMKDGWVNLNSAELRNVYVQGCPSPSSSVIIKKSVIGSGWNSEMKIGDDWYMYLRVLYTGARKAAFTLDRLWRKRVDDINVYDGRKRSEVLRHLYVSDMKRMLSDFKGRMSIEEYTMMQNMHVYSMVELAKHNLIREFNIIETTRLLGRSFRIDRKQTFKSIPDIINKGYKRNLDIRRERKNTKGGNRNL